MISFVASGYTVATSLTPAPQIGGVAADLAGGAPRAVRATPRLVDEDDGR